MKRLFVQFTACALMVAISGILAGWLWLYAKHSSVSFRCGILATAKDDYLHASGRTFQKCSWHLGDGTRTWGETYGFKVRRVYVSMGIKHVNLARNTEESGD